MLIDIDACCHDFMCIVRTIFYAEIKVDKIRAYCVKILFFYLPLHYDAAGKR